MTEGLDHVALAVADLDERIAFFTQQMGMNLRRMGKEISTGSRIAMLGDPASGFKLELIESADRSGLQHIARRVDDVPTAFAQMVAAGLKPLREPRRIAPRPYRVPPPGVLRLEFPQLRHRMVRRRANERQQRFAQGVFLFSI